MTGYQKRLCYTAIGMLILVLCLSIQISYLYASQLIKKSLLLSRQNAAAALVSNIGEIYDVAEKKLHLIAAELSQSSLLSQIENAATMSDKVETIEELNVSMFARLTAQAELSAFYVVTENFIAGYALDGSVHGNVSSFLPLKAPFSFSRSSAGEIHQFLREHIESFQVPLQQTRVAQVGEGRFLVGVVSFEQAFHYTLTSAFCVIDDEQRIPLFQRGFPEMEGEDFGALIEAFDSGEGIYLEGKRCYVSGSFLPQKQLLCFALTGEEEIRGRLHLPFLRALLAAAVLTVGFSLVFYRLSRRIVRPLWDFYHVVADVNDYQDSQGAVRRFIQENQQKKGLKRQIETYYAVGFLPLLAAVTACFFSFSGVIREDVNEACRQSVDLNRQRVRYNLQNYQLFTSYIGLDGELQAALARRLQGGGEEGRDGSRYGVVSLYLFDRAAAAHVRSISVYDTAYEQLYSSSANAFSSSISEACRAYLSQDARYSLWEVEEDAVSLTKRVVSLPSNLPRLRPFITLGYIKIRIDKDAFTPNDGAYEGFHCLLGPNGEIFSASVQGNYSVDAIREILKENGPEDTAKAVRYRQKRIFLSWQPLERTGWTLCDGLRMDTFAGESVQILLLCVACFLFLLLVMAYSSQLLTRSILRPMRRLQLTMKQIEFGQAPSLSFGPEENEFAALAENFREMLLRLQRLGEEIQASRLERVELEKRRNEAQFIALQTQVNPHFLHNIFASITMLLKMGETEKADYMLKCTGRLFRLGLYNGNSLVSIAEELDHAGTHVDIQKIRFQGRIQFEVEMERVPADLQIPKLILQPLIENAIEYGLREKKTVHIRVRFYFPEEKTLMIILSDDGAGMDRQTLQAVQERLKKRTFSKHIGLTNVNERIKLFCGEPYGLQVESIFKEGTTLYLRLPVLVPEKREAPPETHLGGVL